MLSLLKRARKVDAVSKWFQILKGSGVDIDILYGKLEPGAERPVWTLLPHTECDGVGGLHKLLEEESGLSFDPPQSSHSTTSSFGQRMRLLGIKRAEMLSLTGERPHGPGKAHAPEQPNTLAWRSFSPEEAATLTANAKAENATLNSYLLHRVDRAVRNFVQDPKARLAWMIPVNMRGTVPGASRYSNQVSFIESVVEFDHSVGDVHRGIRRSIDEGWHTWFWHFCQNTALLPMSILARAILRETDKGKCYAGAFSNLGRWKRIDPRDESIRFFCPPVAKDCPICFGCLTYGDRLTLTVQAHPSLGLSEARLKKLISII